MPIDRKKRDLKYRESCRERIREYNRKYQASHRLNISKRKREFNNNHKTEVFKQQLQWRNNHREKLREYNRKYKKENKDKIRIHIRNRRAMRLGAPGKFTIGEWELLKKQYGYRCPLCLKGEPEIKLTIDHIIPISMGGSNYIENIQPLCVKCNSSKHQTIIRINPGGQTALF